MPCCSSTQHAHNDEVTSISHFVSPAQFVRRCDYTPTSLLWLVVVDSFIVAAGLSLCVRATSAAPDTLELTEENVEMVLDEVRPYLMSDGGNVEFVEIDGPMVYLR